MAVTRCLLASDGYVNDSIWPGTSSRSECNQHYSLIGVMLWGIQMGIWGHPHKLRRFQSPKTDYTTGESLHGVPGIVEHHLCLPPGRSFWTLQRCISMDDHRVHGLWWVERTNPAWISRISRASYSRCGPTCCKRGSSGQILLTWDQQCASTANSDVRLIWYCLIL